MSRIVAVIPAPSFYLIIPKSSRRSNALASFVVSFGTARVIASVLLPQAAKAKICSQELFK